jgi:protein SFI1
MLRVALQRWRANLFKRNDYYDSIGTIADTFRLRRSFSKWRSALKIRQQAAWKNDMRSRMKLVRDRRDTAAKLQAWTIWKRALKLHSVEVECVNMLEGRFLKKWRASLQRIDGMTSAADQYRGKCIMRTTDYCWDRWISATRLHAFESTIRQKLNLRIMGVALSNWKIATWVL